MEFQVTLIRTKIKVVTVEAPNANSAVIYAEQGEWSEVNKVRTTSWTAIYVDPDSA